jgi:hypothetical protein
MSSRRSRRARYSTVAASTAWPRSRNAYQPAHSTASALQTRGGGGGRGVAPAGVGRHHAAGICPVRHTPWPQQQQQWQRRRRGAREQGLICSAGAGPAGELRARRQPGSGGRWAGAHLMATLVLRRPTSSNRSHRWCPAARSAAGWMRPSWDSSSCSSLSACSQQRSSPAAVQVVPSASAPRFPPGPATSGTSSSSRPGQAARLESLAAVAAATCVGQRQPARAHLCPRPAASRRPCC